MARRERRASRQERLVREATGRHGDTGDGGLAIVDSAGNVLHVAPPSVTEGIRYFIARLQQNEKGAVPPAMAVTSALSGEGATYVARSIASVIANDLGRRVCVLETNWWSSSKAVGAPESDVPQGLSAVLTGSPLDAALVQTVHPCLSILPSGAAPVSARPILAQSGALAHVVEELRDRFDHVIIDVPAVRLTGESLTIAGCADAFTLVVRAGVTREQDVRAALGELSHVTCVGVILNRCSTKIPKRILRLVEA